MMCLFQQFFINKCMGVFDSLVKLAKKLCSYLKVRKNTPNFAIEALSCKVECMTKTVIQILAIWSISLKMTL